jgi:hypothetical protein
VLAGRLAPAQLSGGVVAVELGHLTIHHDHIEAPGGEGRERLAPVADDLDPAACALQ